MTLETSGEDREAQNSIMLTGHISFEHVRQTRQSAADLLSLMSFFDEICISFTKSSPGANWYGSCIPLEIL